ncbi:MAG: acyl-[acyl-carrier-protein]--UDP-N-acetylglucosamine O-acyltransferase, partial [SAR324 cluster bacterium]|nr:acyl-[acyl-carrier-protein]--UDP-N-acetylglucosamine O-acyltransferase [SAR324 cluster bacterium]
MSTTIHPTAIIGEDVEIGAGCVIGPQVIMESGAKIGRDNEINAGCYIFGSVEIGDRNRLMRAASLGGEPQSMGYQGEPTKLIVGSHNWFGENTIMHRGTAATGKTTIG